MNQEEIIQQLQAAVALHNQGELDQAEAIYRNILTVDENNIYALNFYGCICRERKRFDEGIDLLGRAISLQPGNPDVFYNLGNVYKDAERWNEAISCYEMTLGLRADYSEALNNLGTCLMAVERYEHSEIVLSRAVSMQPDFAGAWLNLGNTFKEQYKLEQAIGSYRKAIEVKPDFPEAYLNLGNLLKEGGEEEEAIRSYRRAIELKPDFADAYLNLGNVLKEGGEEEEAIRSYRRAIELKPDFADAYLQAAQACRRLSLQDISSPYSSQIALDYLKKYIQLKPEDAKVIPTLGGINKIQILFANLNHCIGNFSTATKCFESFYRNSVFLDTCASSLPVVSNNSGICVEDIENLLPESCSLIPSFIGYKTASSVLPISYNNLFFSHIPKTAGHGFYDPLSIATTEYLGVTRAHMSSFILSPRFFSDEDVFALSAFLKSSARQVSNSMIMFSNHGEIANGHIIKVMEETFHAKPSAFAFWRDPKSRLLSCIKYLWRSGLSVRSIMQKIMDNDPSLCSSFYRNIFDLDFRDTSIYSSYPKGIDGICLDFLLDLSDMRLIQSHILSSIGAPTMVVRGKFNADNSSCKMPNNELSDVFEFACERGCLEGDDHPAIDSLLVNGRNVVSDISLHQSIVKSRLSKFLLYVDVSPPVRKGMPETFTTQLFDLDLQEDFSQFSSLMSSLF